MSGTVPIRAVRKYWNLYSLTWKRLALMLTPVTVTVAGSKARGQHYGIVCSDLPKTIDIGRNAEGKASHLAQAAGNWGV